MLVKRLFNVHAQLIAMTFEPHPVAILYPEKAPGVLTPLEIKQNQLEKLGVDCLIVLKDSADLLSLSPEDFVKNVIVEHIQPSMVVEGDDFNFGAARAGNNKTLQKLGVEYGFEISHLTIQNN